MRTANSAAQRRKNGFLCNSITIGEPHDQGLVFKWGSLVGIEMPTIGANGTPFRGAADVAFRPREFTGTITSTWSTVPNCTTDFGDYGNTTTDHLSRAHIPANFAKGWGDICRYMGVVDSANWRMPTAAEIAELYGSAEQNKGQAVKLPSSGGWIEGNYYPLAGRAMGPGRNGVSITGSGANARVTNADPNTDGTVFFATCGHRNLDSGAIWRIGSRGYCWSSTASTIDGGYHIAFYSTDVVPQFLNYRTYAFSIRCIRE